MRRLLPLALFVLPSFFACGSSDTSAPSPGPFGGDVPISDQPQIAGLRGPVDVVRDQYGVVHIYATSATDALRVQGYQCAKDRTAQLELIRRSAEGKLAEVLGDSQKGLIDQDIAMRTVGLGRVAKQIYDALPADSELKAWVDAYADGITQFNARLQTGDEALPPSMIGIPKSAFAPWTGVDVLAVGRFQSWNLAYSADDDIRDTAAVQATRAAFSASSPDPARAKRAGMLVDFHRYDPIEKTTTLDDGFPNDPAHTMAPRKLVTPRVDPALFTSARGYQDAIGAVRAHLGDRGSNDWIVSPKLAANGHALLANDPHLSLSAPSVFWMVHVHVDDPDPAKALDFAGTSFPGIAGIILGFNEHVAWGATTADYDVSDVYQETMPDSGHVTFNGAPVEIQKVHETIAIAGSAPLEYDVLVVPHHGPIVPTIVDHAVVPPDPTKGAMSVRWTGHQPTNELAAVAGIVRAKTVEDARTAMRSFEVGAQNWVFADTNGDIFYTTQSKVPLRDKRAFTWDPKTFTGTLPCYVLPGDGTAEWTGTLDEAFVPHVKNPAKGFVATANNDQAGDTLDNDPSNDVLPDGRPIFMACGHDRGFRAFRITERITTAGHPLTLDDMASIQGDAKSPFGARITPALLAAIAHAQEEASTPGSHPDLTALVTTDRFKNAPLAEIADLLGRWKTDSDYDTPAGVSLDDGSPVSDPKESAASVATTVFNAWGVQMVHLTFDDELAAVDGLSIDTVGAMLRLLMADPQSLPSLATYDATLKDSIVFDDMTTTNVLESRDERAVHALLDALDYLSTKLGADRNGWRWGKLHTLRFTSLVSLWGVLSIPPIGDAVFPNGFPRHGDGPNVDVAEYGYGATLDTTDWSYAHGPTQRFVIEMDPAGPIARNVLPGGEIWDNRSPHFRDEAERWRRDQNRPFPFARADVVKAAESRSQYH